MLALPVLAVIALAGAQASSTDDVPSATESYRGRIIRQVRLDFAGGEAPEASRALIELAPGDAYRPEAVRRSIQQLFALGAFSDIKVDAIPVGDQVDVVLRLFPRLEVKAVEIQGLEAGGSHLEGLRKRLVEESGLHPGDPLEIESLSASAGRLTDVLHAEGYLWVRVEPEASFQSPTAVVVFHVAPGARASLGRVEITGVAPHIEADIRRELELTEGSEYSRRELDERVEHLVARWKDLGFYRAAITVEERPSADGRVDLRVVPDMGPKVKIEIVGWDFSEKEQRELVPVFTESGITADLVEESRANLEESLVERGYRNASVVVERESEREDYYLVLRFRCQPGPRFEIRAIEIEGLYSIPEDEVRALLVTRSRRRVRSAPLREKLWDDDLKEVRTYLERHGFHQSSVTSRERIDPTEPNLVTLVMRIDEGPQARVESIQIEGTKEIESHDVLDRARLLPGDPFDASEVVAARERIVNYYHNQGFRQVEVEARTALDKEGRSASVSFVLREGRRVLVDRVIFSGLRVTKESAIRRLVNVKPGEPLSSLAVLETRQKLIGSGIFKSVDIEALPPDPLTQRSDVLITLEEGPRTTFAYGFGYEERQLGRAEFEVTRRNVFGLNRTVSVFTRASFNGGRFITTYRQPDFFGYNLPVFVSAYAEQEDRTSFDYNRVGVGLQLSKKLGVDQNLLLRYRFDRTKVFQLAVDIAEIDRRFRNSRISALSIASVTDRRDDPLNPASGQFRIMDLEWSSRALGTEEPYLKGLAQQFFYLRLPHDMVGAIGLRLGIAQSLLQERAAPIPIAERFFAGGATTLRGFALDQASPKRPIELENGDVVQGEPIGGNVLTLLNLELRFPILGNLRGVLFSDNGNVYPSLEDIELLNWRYNMGFGFRYDTPLGPLRVDYGFKLDRRTVRSIDCPDIDTPCRESFGRWHISLGHAF